MKLVYTGREAEFPPNQAKKLDARLRASPNCWAAVRGRRTSMLTKERFLHQARINVNVWTTTWSRWARMPTSSRR